MDLEVEEGLAGISLEGEDDIGIKLDDEESNQVEGRIDLCIHKTYQFYCNEKPHGTDLAPYKRCSYKKYQE